MKSTTLLLKQDGSKPDNLRTYRYTVSVKFDAPFIFSEGYKNFRPLTKPYKDILTIKPVKSFNILILHSNFMINTNPLYQYNLNLFQ